MCKGQTDLALSAQGSRQAGRQASRLAGWLAGRQRTMVCCGSVMRAAQHRCGSGRRVRTVAVAPFACGEDEGRASERASAGGGRRRVKCLSINHGLCVCFYRIRLYIERESSTRARHDSRSTESSRTYLYERSACGRAAVRVIIGI